MNKDLFLHVYKNKILNIIINREIRYIHNTILDKNCKKFNWKELTESAFVLSQYGYYNQFKLLPTSNLKIIRDCGVVAARFRHFDLLKYIIEISKPAWYEIHSIFSDALRGGNIPIIEYIYSMIDLQNLIIPREFSNAVQSGRIEIFEWFVNHFKVDNFLNDQDIQKNFFIAAIRLENLDVVEWGTKFFIGYRADKNDVSLWNLALDKNNVALLDYMYDLEHFKSPLNLVQCMNKAVFCNIEVFEWILSKDCDGTLDNKQVFQTLLEYGSIEQIEIFSEKLGYKNDNSCKNKAEWFYKKCESYLGSNPFDFAINYYRDIIIIWWYENTDFRCSINPLINCDRSSLHYIQWFTKNNRPEEIPLDTLKRFGHLFSFNNERQLSVLDHIIRYRTEQFPNNQHILRYVLLTPKSMELADLFAMKNKEVICSESILEEAMKMNKLDVVKWIHNKYPTVQCSDNALKSAYFLKDSTMIEWIHQNRTESCQSDSIMNQFRKCSKEVQSFILYNKPEMLPQDVFKYFHDFSQVKFIIDNYSAKITIRTLPNICQSGNVESVKYLHKYIKIHGHKNKHINISSFSKSLEVSINNQFIEIVKYLCENGPDISQLFESLNSAGNVAYVNPMSVALQCGSLEICKYLQEHTPYKLKSNFIDKAVESGNLELVQWVYENHQFRYSNSALELAMKHNFKIVRYLIEKGYKLTSKMLENAIRNSDLEFVKIWLEYGFTYESSVIDFAKSCESHTIVEYLIDIGFKDDATNNIQIHEKENGMKRDGEFIEETNKKYKI